jgi:hypothetical protein
MTLTKIKVGIGNTCGPKFEPVKVYVEYEASIDAEEDEGEARATLHALVSGDVEDFCIDALTRFKGAEEAAKAAFGKDGI